MHKPLLLMLVLMILADSALPAADGEHRVEPASRQAQLTVETGDRGHEITMVYPQDAFIQNGGAIIDITKEPYLAKGSGDPADAEHNTKAFVKVYDFIMAELDKYGDIEKEVTQPSSTNCSYMIYIPDGVYYVNDTLIYSGAIRKVTGTEREYCVWLRFIGQSREKTIIQLVDNCPGFADKANPKPILSFGKKANVNPMKANNAAKNLTISAGAGNPGAIGVRWTSANNGEANELLIKSSDGEGFVGYDFSMGGPCGHFRDIIVEGYDYGIRIGTHARYFYNPSIEYVTLRNQKQAGMLCESGSGTFRKFKSKNSVPALKITDAYTHAILLDSTFSGGDSSNAAIDIIDDGHGIGHIFARNVAVAGYGMGIRKNGEKAQDGSVDEYVSDPILKSASDMPSTSMNLPIEELPYVPWEQDLSKWVTAGKGDGTDDSEAIQQAMNDTSKSVFYFPKRSYKIASGEFPELGTGAKPKAQRMRSGEEFPELLTEQSQERLIPLYVSYRKAEGKPGD